MRSPPSILNAGASLLLFQILGLTIPLLTLPFVARALGVAEFGKVMLAQAIVFFGVLFLDAGFNTEAQRRIALAGNQAQRFCILFQNLVSRSLCALPIAALVVAFSFFFKDIPTSYVLVALLHIVGTLAFPQWWLIGNDLSLAMGLASVGGRLLAAALTLILVRTPDDGLVAVLAASSGTAWAGLLVAPALYKKWKPLGAVVTLYGWRAYFLAVRPTILSGFFSSATASIPSIFLGWVSGIAQVGLFTAADRLTRATAHLVGVVEQSMMGPLARAEKQSLDAGHALRKKLLGFLALAMALGCVAVALAAPEIVQLIYGDKFAPVAQLLRLLCVWLWLFSMRRAGLLFTWSSRGDLKAVARFQWFEAICVTVFSIVGTLWAHAVGLAVGLIAGEVVLILVLCFALRTEGKSI